MFRDTCRRFFETEVQPHHASWEEEGVVPKSVWRKAGELGLLCMDVPEEYGGAGADWLHNVIVIEEQWRVFASGPGFSLHNDITSPYIRHFGTEEQKRRWLPKMVSGEMITAIAMTEPGTGSDLQSVRTNAVKDGDEYVINGAKTFITNGQNADLIIVVCKTDPKLGARGTSLICVEGDRPGFRRGRNLDKIGMKAQDTSELFFDDVRVPASNLLGAEGTGFAQLMQELPQERLVIGVQAIAAIEAALKATIEYPGAQGLRQADHRFPEHPLQAGRAQDQGHGGAHLCRRLRRAPFAQGAHRRRRGDVQVLDDRPAVRLRRPVPAALRRLRLHVGIPDRGSTPTAACRRSTVAPTRS